MGLATNVCVVAALTIGGYIIYDFRSRPTPTSRPASETYPDLTSGGKIIQDSDGRKIAYSEYGSQNRDARVLVFFHGLPGSRIIQVPGIRESCTKHDVRLIVIDRPGIGLTSSSVKNGTSSFDVSPLDVRAVLKEVGCEAKKIGIVGYSMGGPHALQFARIYPEAVDKLYLIAPFGYAVSNEYKRSGAWDYLWKGHDPKEEFMCAPNRAVHFLSRFAPTVLFAGWSLMASQFVYEDSYVDDLIRATSPGDREDLTEEDRRLWRTTTRETFRQGISGLLNAVLETFGKRAPDGWGWDVEELKGVVGKGSVGTYVYAARTDWLTPLSGVVELADSIGIETERLKVYEEEFGHLALLKHALKEILEGEAGGF